ncbi:unnamed protein product [Arabidopsis halleri]
MKGQHQWRVKRNCVIVPNLTRESRDHLFHSCYLHYFFFSLFYTTCML